MLNYFELYNVYTESADIEKCSVSSTKVDYVKYNRKALPANRIKVNKVDDRCLKGYGQIKGGAEHGRRLILILWHNNSK